MGDASEKRPLVPMRSLEPIKRVIDCNATGRVKANESCGEVARVLCRRLPFHHHLVDGLHAAVRHV